MAATAERKALEVDSSGPGSGLMKTIYGVGWI